MSWSLYKALFPQQFSGIADEVETIFGTYSALETQSASQIASSLQSEGTGSGLATELGSWLNTLTSSMSSWDNFLDSFDSEVFFIGLSLYEYYSVQEGYTESEYTTELGNIATLESTLFQSGLSASLFKHLGDLLWTKVRSLNGWLEFRNEAFPIEQHPIIDLLIRNSDTRLSGSVYVYNTQETQYNQDDDTSELAAWLYAKASNVANPASAASWDEFQAEFTAFEQGLSGVLVAYHYVENAETVQDYLDKTQAAREGHISSDYGNQLRDEYLKVLKVRRKNRALWSHFQNMHNDANPGTQSALQNLANSLREPIEQTTSYLPADAAAWESGYLSALTDSDTIIVEMADWLTDLNTRVQAEFASPTWTDYLSLVHPHYASAVDQIKKYHDDQTDTLADYLAQTATVLKQNLAASGAYNTGSYDFLTKVSNGLEAFTLDAAAWVVIGKNINKTHRSILLFGESLDAVDGENYWLIAPYLSAIYSTYDAFSDSDPSSIAAVIGNSVSDLELILANEYKQRALEAIQFDPNNNEWPISITQWEGMKLSTLPYYEISRGLVDYHESITGQSPMALALLSYEQLGENLVNDLYANYDSIIAQLLYFQIHAAKAFDALENQFNTFTSIAVEGFRNNLEGFSPQLHVLLFDFSFLPAELASSFDLEASLRSQASSYPSIEDELPDGLLPADSIIGKLGEWLQSIAQSKANWSEFESEVGEQDWSYVGELKAYYDNQSVTYAQFAAKSIDDIIADVSAADTATDFFGLYLTVLRAKVAEVFLPGNGGLLLDLPWYDIGGFEATAASIGVEHGYMNPAGTAELSTLSGYSNRELAARQLEYFHPSGTNATFNFILPMHIGGLAQQAYDQYYRGEEVFDYVASQFLPEQQSAIKNLLQDIASEKNLSADSLRGAVSVLFIESEDGTEAERWFFALSFKLLFVDFNDPLVLARAESYRALASQQLAQPTPSLPAPDPTETFVVSAQLLDEGAAPAAPAFGIYKVEVEQEDPDDPGTYATLVETQTSRIGIFTFAFSSTPDSNGDFSPESFRFSVTTEDDAGVVVTANETVNITPPDIGVQQIEVTVPAPVDNSPVISTELPNYGSYDAALTGYLSTNNLTTLSNVRKHGGLAAKAKTESAIADNLDDAKEIDAHAEFDLLPNTIGYNQQLIDAGYKTLGEIAMSNRAEFVSTMEAVDTDVTAFTTYKTAGAINHSNKLTKVGLMTRNRMGEGGYATFEEESGGASEDSFSRFADDCACDDCETSVSPLAYLSSLLEYATNNIYKGSSYPTVEGLSELFQQDFDRLPLLCSELNKQVCQLRLAVELLWRIVDDDEEIELLEGFKSDYLKPVYEFLLSEAGGSYSELKLLYESLSDSFYDDRRERLANKLQVEVDDLIPLFVEDVNLDEDKLFELFGLQTTTGDPYSVGRKIDDYSVLLKRHTFEQIKWGVNTNEDGKVYLKVDQADDPYDNENPLYAKVYADIGAEADNEVARGAILFANGEYTCKLYPIKDSNLSGELVLNATTFENSTGTTTITFQLVPTLLCMRYRKQIAQWRNLDGLDISAFANRPIIDPDLVGPDDFRVTSGSSSMFEVLWEKRYNQLYTVSQNPTGAWGLVTTFDKTNVSGTNKDRIGVWIYGVLEQNQAYGPNINFYNSYQIFNPSSITSVSPTPTSFGGGDYLSTILIELNSGNDSAIDDIENALNLTIPSFRRLMTIWQQPVVSDEELEEVKNIFVAAGKKAFSEDWLSQEDPTHVNYALNPKEFWPSITRPKSGDWDLSTRNAFIETQFNISSIPAIDPDFISIDELPDSPVGDDARDLFRERKDTLAENYDELKLAWEQKAADGLQAFDSTASSLHEMAEEVYGVSSVPNYDSNTDFEGSILQLKSDIDLGNSSAETFLFESLKLTLEQLEILDEIAQLIIDNAQVSAGLVEEMLSIFNTVRKYEQLYSTWATADNSLKLWELYKHHLPSEWRVKQADRTAFERYVTKLYETPIIEPDILGPGDFHNPEDSGAITIPANENPAYHKFVERKDTVATDFTDLLTPAPITSSGGFDAVFEEVGLIVIANGESFHDEIAELEDAYKAGLPEFNKRLAQLTVGGTEFAYLLKLVKQLAESNDLSEPQVEDLKAIATNIRKKREYPAWHYDELDPTQHTNAKYANTYPLFINPLQFLLLNLNVDQRGAYYNAIFSEWRSDRAARRRYERVLRSRIESLQGQAETLYRTRQDADEKYLQGARDALVPYYEPASSMTNFEKGRDIGRRYLIDMGYECCSTTTRIAQAITTMQTLFQQLRLNQQHSDLDTYAIVSENYDEDWEWLQSYERWRSLMFVYLYPENLLNPEYHPRRTEFFKGIVSEARNSRNFNPEHACRLLESYEDYMNDIRNLRMGDAAIAYVPAVQSDCQEESGTPGKLKTYFVGAHSTVSGKGYLLIDQPDEHRRPQPRAWEQVPGFEKVSEMLATEVYRTEDGELYLYVFAEARGPLGEIQLIANRMNLETWAWEEKQVVEYDYEKEALKHKPENYEVTQRWVFAERRDERSPIVFGRTWRIGYTKNLIWLYLKSTTTATEIEQGVKINDLVKEVRSVYGENFFDSRLIDYTISGVVIRQRVELWKYINRFETYFQSSFFKITAGYNIEVFNGAHYFFHLIDEVNLLDIRNNDSSILEFEPLFKLEFKQDNSLAEFHHSGKFIAIPLHEMEFTEDNEKSFGVMYEPSQHLFQNKDPLNFDTENFFDVPPHFSAENLGKFVLTTFLIFDLKASNPFENPYTETFGTIVDLSVKNKTNSFWQMHGHKVPKIGSYDYNYVGMRFVKDAGSGTFDYKYIFSRTQGNYVGNTLEELSVSHKGGGWDKETTWGSFSTVMNSAGPYLPIDISPAYVTSKLQEPTQVVGGSLNPGGSQQIRVPSLNGNYLTTNLQHNIKLSLKPDIGHIWFVEVNSKLLLTDINSSLVDQPFARYLIWEAFYFVPLYIAQQLEANGYYIEALELMRTIFDYTESLGNRKKFWDCYVCADRLSLAIVALIDKRWLS